MLLEEDESSGDIFRCLVGNLPPGAEAAIKFAYAIELKLSPDGSVEFVLPTQLNPRYNPSEAGFYIRCLHHRRHLSSSSSSLLSVVISILHPRQNARIATDHGEKN